MKNKPKDPIIRQLSDEYVSLDLKIKDLRKEADNLSSKIKVAQREQEEIRAELGFARDAMNSESEKMQINRRENQRAWDIYRRILDRNNPEIDRLKSQADNKASTMKNCFAKSQSCWQSGDKSSAKYYSDEGKKLKSEVEDLNSRISDLCAENKCAKPVNSGSLNYAFNNAKSIFDRVKQDFDRKKEITRELITKHQSVISKIKDIQSEKNRISSSQKNRIKELKAEKDRQHRKKQSEWLDLQFGTIDGHEVWFRQHRYKNQILISDSRNIGPNGEGFDNGRKSIIKGKHNHYGWDKNDNFVKDRSFYKGPGHK